MARQVTDLPRLAVAESLRKQLTKLQHRARPWRADSSVIVDVHPKTQQSRKARSPAALYC